MAGCRRRDGAVGSLGTVIPWSDWLSTRIEYGAEKPWFQRVASQIVSGAPFASLLVETWANQDTFSGPPHLGR